MHVDRREAADDIEQQLRERWMCPRCSNSTYTYRVLLRLHEYLCWVRHPHLMN